MKDHDLVEIDVPTTKGALRLRRAENSSQIGVVAPQTVNIKPHHVPSPSPSREDIHVVKSPFVGIFYRCPGPNQESFVEEGKTVSSGDTLCIVEAMKLMNEIESDVKGRVVKVLVKNGTPVEFGEALFEIEKI